MTTPTLTVVMPVRNEAADLAQTVDALCSAVERSGFDAELVLVDDGSTDGSADVADSSVAGRLPLRVLSQPNRGRFEARRAGVDAAAGEWVLLLDGRVRIRPDALLYVHDRLEQGSRIWTAHVHVHTEGSPFGEFWKLLAELAWNDYFENPRETSFGPAEFDRFPKGTTCFLAPRALLIDTIADFRSAYADSRHANDDTPIIRRLSQVERINISPRFDCDYRPRTTFAAFVRHAVHRGVVFLDGHGRLESRFFPAVAAFYPLSAVLVAASLRKPLVAPAALLGISVSAVTLGIARRRSAAELASLALVTPLYGVAHGYGMWRGLATMLRQPRPGGPRR